MRAIRRDLENVKTAMRNIEGKRMLLEINRGRNKIDKFEGVISKLYPAIFTVTEDSGKQQSYSYNDILSRNIKIYNAK